MATDKQIEANRANAQKSTGPRTEAGKAKSRYNATKHGLSGQQVVLPGEDPAEFDALQEEIFETLQPTDRLQAEAAAQIAVNVWLLRRIPRLKAALAMWGTYKRFRDQKGPLGWMDRDEDAETAADEELKAQYPGRTPADLQQMKALGEFLDQHGLTNMVRLATYQNTLSRQMDRDLERLKKLQSRSITIEHPAPTVGGDASLDEPHLIDVAPERMEEPVGQSAEGDV